MLDDIAKWTLVVVMVTGALVSIAQIGKQRKPTTPTDVVGTTVINAVLITAVIALWHA